MNVISYTLARKEFSKTMEEVCHSHSPVVITRANNEPVVMLSLEDFNSMQETSYLLKSPENAKRLSSSIDEVEKMIAKKSSCKKAKND